jgi:hypothetical protein
MKIKKQLFKHKLYKKRGKIVLEMQIKIINKLTTIKKVINKLRIFHQLKL